MCPQACIGIFSICYKNLALQNMKHDTGTLWAAASVACLQLPGNNQPIEN